MSLPFIAAMILCISIVHCSPTRTPMKTSQNSTVLPTTSSPTLAAFRPCDERVCASRISACQLMNLCNCNGPDCSCCADCTQCLGSLWNDCCDCLGLCLAYRESSSPFKSVVGDVISIPSLFNALSEEGPDSLPTVFVYRPLASIIPVQLHSGNLTKSSLTYNDQICKSAFFNDCRSLKNCKNFCVSMGAQRFRWFLNGCCQCVGSNCADYGETTALCKNCGN